MINESQVNLCFIQSLNMSNYHHTLFRDNELGIQKETITNKTDGGFGLGKSNTSFYIDNDVREFLSLDELITAYNEKFKHEEDTPDMEVKYVKILVKREK